jgi:hypothetical protein
MVDIDLELPTEATIYRPFDVIKSFTLTEGSYDYPVVFHLTVPAGRTVTAHLNVHVEEVE